MADRSDASLSNELSGAHRAALAQWADEDPPDGFADAVMDAWAAECAAQPVAAPLRSGGRTRWIVIAGAVAASIAVLWLARAATATATDSSMAHAPVCDPGARQTRLGFEHEAEQPSRSLADDADALAVLVRHCTPCHDGEHSDAQPGALRVYDVAQPEFWQGMTDAQLREADLRVQQLGASTNQERRSMASFVDSELRRRAHSG